MESQHGSSETDSGGDETAPPRGPTVSVHETAPERVVFTEDDNRDGWIATDLTVDLRR